MTRKFRKYTVLPLVRPIQGQSFKIWVVFRSLLGRQIAEKVVLEKDRMIRFESIWRRRRST